MQSYEGMIERIAKSSGLEKEEIEKKVDAKKEKLSGLISKEGAAQIIAAEMGISFEDSDLKVSEITAGMRKINFVGKIINLFPIREYNKNGREGKVANFIMADETGNIRVVLWDVNHIALIENEEIKLGDVVEVRNASSRDSEVHLSGFSEIKKSEVSLENVVEKREVIDKFLEDVRQGENVAIRAVVVNVFPPRFYNVCPQCNKKVNRDGEKDSCAEHGVVSSNKRAILNFVIDDGTETIRVVMFSGQIKSLVDEKELEDFDKAEAFKEDFLGSEIKLNGIVKRNQLFNNLEIIANYIERVDVEKLIAELETSS